MSTTEVTGSSDADVRIGPGMDLKLEVVVLPVSDVDRAKTFYERLGWRLDADVDVEGFTLVQLTPPGSRCSIQFGTHATTATPGSVQNVYLVVPDIEAVRRELLDRGVEVGVVEDDERCVPTQFEGDFLYRRGALAHQELSDFGRPGEREFAHQPALRELGAHFCRLI